MAKRLRGPDGERRMSGYCVRRFQFSAWVRCSYIHQSAAHGGVNVAWHSVRSYAMDKRQQQKQQDEMDSLLLGQYAWPATLWWNEPCVAFVATVA